MRRVGRLLLFCLVTALSGGPAPAQPGNAGEVMILRPWAPPSVGGNGAGYLSIVNHGAAPETLLSATCPAADHVSLHAMSMEGDVMRMTPLEHGLAIAPGETVTLAPGRIHLMLSGLHAPLKAGDRLPLTLTFRQAGTIRVELPVEMRNPMPMP